MKKRKYLLRMFTGIIISIIFLYLAIRRVNFVEIVKIISSVNLIYLLLAFILGIFGLFVRSKRWQFIVNKKESAYFSFFESTCIGLMTNNILPFRIGDFAQAYFLSRKENLSKIRSFSTVIMERLVDLIPPALILITGSFFVLLPEQIQKEKVIVFIAILFVLLFFVIKSQDNLIKFIQLFLPHSKFKEKIINLLFNFYTGIKSINNPWIIVKIFSLTFFVWFIYAVSTYFSLLSFGIQLTVPKAALIMSITVISVMIPSSPGYIGTWEFFTILALAIFGIGKTHALSYSIVNHFLAFLPVTLFGFILLLKSGISISQLENEEIKSDNNLSTQDKNT